MSAPPAILVHSREDDIHAAAMIWGLERLGRRCVFWPSGKFPAEQALSLAVGSTGDRAATPAIEADRRMLPAAKTVWNRRPTWTPAAPQSC